MSARKTKGLWALAVVIAAGTVGSFPTIPSRAAVPEVTEPPYFSGQTAFGQSTVEPSFDDVTGNTVFLLTPNHAPNPSHAAPPAQSPLYIPVYPTSSTIPADHLDCQSGWATGTGNCTHLQVLPFYDSDYDSNSADANGSSKACHDFNGGKPCTVFLGHDHLVGVASTGGDFNVAWHVYLVVFTAKAFGDGAINSRITTLSQMDGLIVSGDLSNPIPTSIVFNCQVVPKRVYSKGTPVTYPFP
jgi:hypothetical protein